MFKLTLFPSFVYAAPKIDDLAPGFQYTFNSNDFILVHWPARPKISMEFYVDEVVIVAGDEVTSFTDVDEALEHLAGIFQ